MWTPVKTKLFMRHIQLKREWLTRDRSKILRNAVEFALKLDRTLTASEIASALVEMDIIVFEEEIEEIINDL